MRSKRKHHIGSHSRSSIPDEKMHPKSNWSLFNQLRWQGWPNHIWSSAQRQTVQALSNRKRRQRDNKIAKEDLE